METWKRFFFFAVHVADQVRSPCQALLQLPKNVMTFRVCFKLVLWCFDEKGSPSLEDGTWAIGFWNSVHFKDKNIRWSLITGLFLINKGLLTLPDVYFHFCRHDDKHDSCAWFSWIIIAEKRCCIAAVLRKINAVASGPQASFSSF